MAYIYDIADTWNASGTTFKGIALNVTDSASAAGSLLMDLQVGGTSRFGVSKDGNVYLQGGVSTHFIANSNGGGLACNNSGFNDGSYEAVYTGYGTRFGSSASVGWASSATVGASGGSPDTFLFRDAANTLAQRNGVNAQAFNLYQSYTDASNYTRGRVVAASGIVTIAGESAGTGATDIDIALTPKGTGRVRYGTHAAIAAETVTGYIEIKDAGGTVRKIAVVS